MNMWIMKRLKLGGTSTFMACAWSIRRHTSGKSVSVNETMYSSASATITKSETIMSLSCQLCLLCALSVAVLTHLLEQARRHSLSLQELIYLYDWLIHLHQHHTSWMMHSQCFGRSVRSDLRASH